MKLEELIQKYPQECAEVTQAPPTVEFEKLPPFKLPSIDNFKYLENKYKCIVPQDLPTAKINPLKFGKVEVINIQRQYAPKHKHGWDEMINSLIAYGGFSIIIILI